MGCLCVLFEIMDRRGRDAESSHGNGRDQGHRDLNRGRHYDRQVERGRAWDRRYDDSRNNDRHGRGGERDRSRDRHGNRDYDRRVRPPDEDEFDRGYDDRNGRNRRRHDEQPAPPPRREPESPVEYHAEAPTSPNRSAAADMVKAIVERAKLEASERWASLSKVQPSFAARQPEDPPFGHWMEAPMPVPTSPWMMAPGAPWPMGAMPPISTAIADGGTITTAGGASVGSASVAAPIAFTFAAPPPPPLSAAAAADADATASVDRHRARHDWQCPQALGSGGGGGGGGSGGGDTAAEMADAINEGDDEQEAADAGQNRECAYEGDDDVVECVGSAAAVAAAAAERRRARRCPVITIDLDDDDDDDVPMEKVPAAAAPAAAAPAAAAPAAAAPAAGAAADVMACAACAVAVEAAPAGAEVALSFDAAAQKLISLGFERGLAHEALRRCGGDLEAAIHELLSAWQTSGHEWIGSWVTRVIDGIEIDARVTKWIPADGTNPALWHVLHTDGDEEDLDEAEMQAALEAFEQRTSNRPSSSKAPLSSKAPVSSKAPSSSKPLVAPQWAAPVTKPLTLPTVMPVAMRQGAMIAASSAPPAGTAVLEAALEQLMAMGFGRLRGQQALQQTSNDLQAALDLLLVPPTELPSPPSPSPPPPPPPPPQQPPPPADFSSTSSSSSDDEDTTVLSQRYAQLAPKQPPRGIARRRAAAAPGVASGSGFAAAVPGAAEGSRGASAIQRASSADPAASSSGAGGGGASSSGAGSGRVVGSRGVGRGVGAGSKRAASAATLDEPRAPGKRSADVYNAAPPAIALPAVARPAVALPAVRAASAGGIWELDDRTAGGEPLIERVRRENIARNNEILRKLGLDSSHNSLLLREPKLVARRPRRPTDSNPTRHQPARGAQTSAANASRTSLGFEWGVAQALLGYQAQHVMDLLYASYDQATADEIVESVCVCAPGTVLGAVEQGGPALSIILFARLGFRVVGAAAIRFHWFAGGERVAEILFVAVPTYSRGDGVAKALVAYVQLLTALGDSERPFQLFLWRHTYTDVDMPLGDWTPCQMDYSMSTAMPGPPGAPSSDRVALELLAHRVGSGSGVDVLRRCAWHALRLAVALAANESAAVDILRREMLSGELQACVEPLEDAPTGCNTGQLVALWSNTDACFFESRIDEFQVRPHEAAKPARDAATPSGPIVLLFSHMFRRHFAPCQSELAGVLTTLNANNGLLPLEGTRIKVATTSMKFDEAKQEYELDEKVDALYQHELVRCRTTLDASDREASIRSGFAIDRNGGAFNLCHERRGTPKVVLQRPFLPIGIEVDLSTLLFPNQLSELQLTILGVHSVQLPTHWHGFNGASRLVPNLSPLSALRAAPLTQTPSNVEQSGRAMPPSSLVEHSSTLSWRRDPVVIYPLRPTSSRGSTWWCAAAQSISHMLPTRARGGFCGSGWSASPEGGESSQMLWPPMPRSLAPSWPKSRWPTSSTLASRMPSASLSHARSGTRSANGRYANMRA